MSRPAVLTVLALLLAGPAAAQAPSDTLRLDTAGAIRMALADSPEVAIEEAGVAFARARAAQARAARYLTEAHITTGHAFAPTLDIPDDVQVPRNALYLDPRVRNDWTNPRPYSQVELELLQPIFTWGELGGQIRAAEAAVAVEEAAAAATARTVALRTAELVEGLRAASELARLADDAQRVLNEARTELQRLLDDGDPDVSDADLFQVRLFEQELRRRQVEVVESRAIAESALARLLRQPGAPLAVGLQEPVALPEYGLDELQSLALASRAEVRQAAAGMAARSALVRVARSHFYPKVFAAATVSGRYSIGREHQGNPFIGDPYLGGGVRAGIGIRQDLTFLQTRARVAQAEAQLNEVRHQREAAEQLILFEVEEAYRNVAIARAALDARQEGAAIAAEWLRTEQINYDLALGRVADLVAAARADLDARLALVDATRAYNIAAYRLLAASGALVERAAHGTLFEPSPAD
jgi:outer membrane protein